MGIGFLDKALQLSRGCSYWRVELKNGKVHSELDQKMAFEGLSSSGLPIARSRKIEWTDLVKNDDVKNIRYVTLVTPKGEATLYCPEDYTAIQMKKGTMIMLCANQRMANAQIIGRVDNRHTGACTAIIWDVQKQDLYIDHETSIYDFKKWNADTADIGAINWKGMGIRLDESYDKFVGIEK